ncbi:MAG: cytochrome c oxidase accessory protein CcoG [Pseudomonadota bacterium]
MLKANKVIPIIQANLSAEQEQSLYEIRKKIYPRAVTGWFANWRIAMVIFTQVLFYGVAWLSWNGRQAVLFDLAARKFYIFGVIFLPQDFIYLTVLLVISALSLFLFTAVAGRLFCGFACPQTVYTQIFLWIEHSIEGDRMQRMKLDHGPADIERRVKKVFKHFVWIVFAAWTGFTFVGYFSPIRELFMAFLQTKFSPWETFWIVFYGFATYGNAGWMREQVCKYMCPYARFQSVMFDRDTLVITYDEKRGEPRGARSRDTDRAEAGVGDCIDCQICVQVCPTGIDIRKGLQYECIGCAACIDACDQVMDKMNYPKGLIRYTTENALAKQLSWKDMVKRVLRPRILAYTAVVWAIIIAAAISVFSRTPLKVDVIRDRATLARQVDETHAENVYQLRIMNSDEKTHHFSIRASGLNNLEVLTQSQLLEIGPAATKTIPVRLRAEVAHTEPGSHRIDFIIEASDDAKHPMPEVFSIHEKSAFLVPR